MPNSLRLPVIFGGVVILLFGVAKPGRAELRYAPEAGASHAYSVEITAELPDATETLKGVVVYTVKERNQDQIKLEYRGGLNRTRKAKAQAGNGPPRGPRRPGRPTPGPRSPFEAPTFKGLTQTTNQLTLTSRGDVVAIEGSSQLPYLLGNLSTLIFEPLPEKQQDAWEVQNGIAITEANERQSFPRFGPRRPGFNPPQTEGQRTAGTETSKYKITSTEGESVSIEKTYSLESPVVDGKGFGLEGKGTWVFHQAKSFPQKLDFRQVLKVQFDNVSVELPITCKYELLNEEQFAEHQKAEEKRQAEMKALLAEAQEKAKARRQAPFTAEQKAEVLKQLGSGNIGEVRRGLNALQFKNPQEPDAEIAAALEKLANHTNQGIRRQAEQISKKWAKP